MGFGGNVHIPALLSVSGIVVSGIADSGSGRAATIAARINPPPRVFATGADLIDADEVDGVVVATPPRAQSDFVRRALMAGKPVLCEKPVGLNFAITAALASEARSRDAVACVGFEFRYDRGIRLLCNTCREGRIGPLERIDVAWITSGGVRMPARWSWRNDINEAGGVITEFAIHVIDYMRWISGEGIEAFKADGGIRVRKRVDAEGRVRPVTAPDVLEFFGRTASGIRLNAVVSNAYAAALGHRIVLTGRSGKLTFLHRPPFGMADWAVTLETPDGSSCLSDTDGAGAQKREEKSDTRVLAFAALFRDFARAARGEPGVRLPSFEDAAAARRVTHAIEVATGFAN